MTTVTPFLWFNDNAGDAIERYQKVFPDTEVVDEQRMPDGNLFIATIRIKGQELVLMNGGPSHQLTEAFSLSVGVETQQEVDEISDALDRRRRRAGHLRLARRRLRSLLAGRPVAARQAAERPRSREGRPRPGRDDADDATRHPGSAGRVRRQARLTPFQLAGRAHLTNSGGMSPTRSLVTGATGYVGGRLVPELVRRAMTYA